MSDLIDRQAAIDAIISFFKLTDYNESAYAVRTVLGDLPPAQPAELDTLIKALEQEHRKLRKMQTAQPEIVHCKDCQHSEYDALYGDRYCHHNGKAEIVPDDHYCGYAERRTDG